MPYTIGDWVRERAQIRIKVPDPVLGWRELWLPVDIGDALEGLEIRTQEGRELQDLLNWLRLTDEERAETLLTGRWPGERE